MLKHVVLSSETCFNTFFLSVDEFIHQQMTRWILFHSLKRYAVIGYNNCMDYLVRIHQGKSHLVAHYVHEVNGIVGALCSRKPTPAVGEQTQMGQWELVSALPSHTRVCLICRKRKQKIDNPLPARVERDLERLAQWDPRAGKIQREKMLKFYREKAAR